MQTDTASPKKISPAGILLIGAAAVVLYGLFAGFRANTSILSAWMTLTAQNSYGSINIVFSCLSLVLGISGPIFGYLTIKTSSRTIILTGTILTTIGLAGTALVTTLAGYLVFTGIIFALGASALGYSILYAASVPFIGEKRSVVFAGILSAAEGIFSSTSSPVLEWLINDFGFSTCMAVFAAISFLIIPLSFLFRSKRNTDESEQQAAKAVSIPGILREMVKNPFFYLLGFAFLVHGILCGCMSNHQFADSIASGIPADLATLGVSVYGFSFIIGSLAGGFAASKCKNRLVLLGSMFGIWGTAMLVSYCFNPASVLIVNSLILGMIASGLLPVFAGLIQEKVSLLKFAATYTVLDLMYRLGYSFDAVYEGYLYDFCGSFFYADMSIAALVLLCAALSVCCGLRMKKRENKN
ncbi:MAG TPA: MFS transporter [Methanocorpusculum sp.]|nr:MFS transporter [Methanocorpusculum sp.]